MGDGSATTVERPRVGVGLLIRRGNDVLLMRRAGAHGHGTWSTPGGYLEFGEDPAEAAVREAREETGLDVGPASVAGVTNDVFVDEGKHSVTLWFEAEYAGGELSPDPEEVAELAWFDHASLPEPLFLSLRHLVDGERVA